MKQKDFCTASVIQYLLFACKKHYGNDDRRYMTFIPSIVLPKWREWITKRFGDNSFLDMGPYKLRIIQKVYDVHLVSFIRTDERIVGADRFSFKWKDNLAFFTDLEGFSQLKNLIQKLNLEKCVEAIQTWQGIDWQNNTSIKIVTLTPIRNITTLLYQYRAKKTFFELFDVPDFLVCQTFPWFNPSRLPSFDKQSVNDEFFVGLITFLQCQRELCYDMKSEFTLNVFDLCSLKLAFCPEFGIESRACAELAYEIDELIVDSLNRLAKDKSKNGYFSDNHSFNLIQYAKDREIDFYTQDLACFYFIYNFQDWFKSITIPSLLLDIGDSLTISLAKERKCVLSRLSNISQFKCEIDGTKFSGMDFKLFYGILKSDNVKKIILDTNYRWLNACESNYVSDGKQILLWTEIEFIGDNQFNFIEDCIECLKTIESCDSVELTFINQNISNFVIFENLHVARIKFQDLTLTSTILHNLITCEFPRNTVFEDCRIEDDVQSWTLLNELTFSYASIMEEEKTWQYLYESIFNQIKGSKQNQYRFKNNLEIKTQNGKLIKLQPLKFTINESKSKLEIRNRYTNEILDLFDLKNEMENNSKLDSEQEDDEAEPSSKRQRRSESSVFLRL